MTVPKKLFIKTYGCQMNVYDSERMAEALAPEGYVQSDTPEGADMILLNTCHIREKAAEKVYSELGRMKLHKQDNPNLKIGVAGCVAQAEGAEIMRRQPAVDLVVGPQSYHRLPELLVKNKRAAIETAFPIEDKFDHLPNRGAGRGPKARRAPASFLTVQEGCDKFCAFCVVPYTRGAEFSRPVDRVLREARDLVERGVREITLLGQNVNAYHGAKDSQTWGLAQLIWALSEIDGLERIRFTTSHPNDMDSALIEAHAGCAKLMPYLHLPVQSGSDKILKLMNRKHTAQSYLDVVGRIRAARPDLMLSGDFIVGFPGETDQDFQDTLELVRKVKYGQAYSFKYSARPGTPAAERDDVPTDIADARLQTLQALLRQQQVEAQEAMIGKTVGVLFERTGREPGQLVGKSDHLHSVYVQTQDHKIGDLVQVRITRSQTNSLEGRIL